MDAEVLKRRRLEARRLLDEGVTQAEVARRLEISRQSVSRWARLRSPELAKVRRQGRKPGLSEAARAKLRTALLAGPKAAGFATELWTVPRVRQLIVQRCRRHYSAVHVWRLLRQLGFSPQRPVGRARERDEAKIADWKSQEWPRLKKSPAGAPHPRLPRRKRIEPKAASGPHVGTPRADPGAHFQLQLEKRVGDRRADAP